MPDPVERELEQDIRLVHPDGTRVTVHLPAPASTASAVLVRLSKLGFDFDRKARCDNCSESRPLQEAADGRRYCARCIKANENRPEFQPVERATTSNQRGG